MYVFFAAKGNSEVPNVDKKTLKTLTVSPSYQKSAQHTGVSATPYTANIIGCTSEYGEFFNYNYKAIYLIFVTKLIIQLVPECYF